MTAPTVDVAGVVTDLPEQEYHSHPALSHSGVKKLLAPSCPAKFRYERDNPPPPTDAMELGTAAHKLVLGVGCDLVEVEAKDWRTKAAQEQADDARASGAIPLLTKQMRVVEGMAAALRKHPDASALLNRDNGQPEVSLFATDDETGVALRARVDFLPDSDARDRLLLTDYKSCASAHPEKFAKSAFDYGYYSQAAFYIDIVRALGLDDDPAFLLLAQEKEPPYLISIFEPDPEAVRYGRSRNREAIDLYATCVADDHWPGYTSDVALISLPRWMLQ